ncbi:MAG TPA: AsnC family protein [Candidatus Methylomirabilis sp.]|nr:AsnC family protein [Candidatus Methylomirabilis sp.]
MSPPTGCQSAGGREDRSMVDWWTETDRAILDCLRQSGPLSPTDLGHRLGLSAGEVTCFLSMLIGEGKVRIRAVELDDAAEPSRPNEGARRTREARRSSRLAGGE